MVVGFKNTTHGLCGCPPYCSPSPKVPPSPCQRGQCSFPSFRYTLHPRDSLLTICHIPTSIPSPLIPLSIPPLRLASHGSSGILHNHARRRQRSARYLYIPPSQNALFRKSQMSQMLRNRDFRAYFRRKYATISIIMDFHITH